MSDPDNSTASANVYKNHFAPRIYELTLRKKSKNNSKSIMQNKFPWVYPADINDLKNSTFANAFFFPLLTASLKYMQ